jgi:hypothetical protein
MTLTEFFQAVTAAGVRLANVCGQLQLQGPAGAITPELQAGAAEHKEAILALLPSPPGIELEEVSVAHSTDPAGPGRTESPQAGTPAQKQAPPEAIRSNMASSNPYNGFRHEHDWRDWRLDWLLEVGTLFLRMRGCQDPEVLGRLRPLVEATPTTMKEWLALGEQIASTEHELRQRGKLPPYPWPLRGEP